MRLTSGPPGAAADGTADAASPTGAGSTTRICSPSTRTRARFSPDRSTPPRAPPAAFSASTTRDPGSRTAIPGRRTFPGHVDGDRARRGGAARPWRPRCRAEGPDGAAVASGADDAVAAPGVTPAGATISEALPRSTHQQVTARPRAIRRASTVTCGGPRATRPRSVSGPRPRAGARPAATRAGPGPAPRERARPATEGLTAPAPPAPSRPPPAHPRGRHRPDGTSASSALSWASRRATASWCSGVGRRVRMGRR